ncbi:MAG: 1-acyl-sn-glycerol-3-phosphate acyltransferase [Ruminococcus sp.]|nr:1-acyl-sn-glycerol-3-phosphate acyltransferase [Ruminococcus sp.]
MSRPKNHAFYNVVRAIFKPIFYLKDRIKIEGRENVPEEGAYILASNHIEATDPIHIGLAIKRQIMFMAKAELFENKFAAWFFRHLGAFPVDRGKGDKTAINHFEEVIKEGYLMGIFIEGTRSKTGEFLPPKNGVSLIAYDTKAPVIPICVTKTKRGKVVHFDKPLSIEELGLLNGKAREFRVASRMIMEKIKALREEDLAKYDS